jgi:TctA family transporter
MALDFAVAPILLGYVLGPMVEENFRRALLVSRGDPAIFLNRPISAAFIALCALIIGAQLCFAVRKLLSARSSAEERELNDASQAG